MFFGLRKKPQPTPEPEPITVKMYPGATVNDLASSLAALAKTLTPAGSAVVVAVATPDGAWSARWSSDQPTLTLRLARTAFDAVVEGLLPRLPAGTPEKKEG